jgi:hypothetical protein
LIVRHCHHRLQWTSKNPDDDHSSPGPDYQAALRALPDRPGLGSLVEQLVQLPGSNGRDQGVDHRRQLVRGRNDDPGLALLELDGPGPNLMDITTWPDGPVLPRPNEQLLLLQPGDELGPAMLDRIVPGLGKGGEGEWLEDWHVGSPLLDETSPILITCMTLYMPPTRYSLRTR